MTRNIEFLSDHTRTYTTFIVGAGAIAYYVSGIFIKSIALIIMIEILYLFVWLMILDRGRKELQKEGCP
ncbi:hypothetical protein HZA98_00410 [Candidatus Woesearchaeota archaeon]|nr:hypothetical protein [Candidatus Woesearchaeota archaeon]